MNSTFTSFGAFPSVQSVTHQVSSRHLGREVTLTVLLPPGYDASARKYPLLLVHDGQDFPALGLAETLQVLYQEQAVEPLIVVGTHANHDRIYEYGTAHQPDYAQRGNRAAAHTQFVLEELLPFLETHFCVSTQREQRAVAGCSLGGLMALDLAWNNPQYFSRVAVFSGALWWRSRALDNGYDDQDRIMHRQIREASTRPELKCWFQVGTLDETDDRDGDGVIDSIADTLDCIAELERQGYRWGRDVKYLEVPGGEHNPATWGRVLPDFLRWAFPGQGPGA
ncbi:hypothetical protein GCM10027275_13170 [Rhabdobacter roseus]|uniref:Enterochelin esterase-like enzyme n=1 Tax=Rhabdobacter roseus TaxID=1655419 RepID=A0A840TPS6_9BACT|nr:alpha/beta hydrolase-fold protein [Rhabdobacter roseus]MBB5283233.1 enterochelin esterase-like enzyme [Rhabdobacter roseus]